MTMIPFLPEFEDALRSGRKTCTARTKKYGGPGDVLDTSFGFQVKLTLVNRTTLDVIRDFRWECEGVISPGDFENVWNRLHPRSRFDPYKRVWLHEFEACGFTSLRWSGETPSA